MSARDSSLRALFLRDPDPPVELAALVLAKDFSPDLDVSASLAALDALAAPLAARVAHLDNARDLAAALGTWLFDACGFHGNEDDYYDPRNSYLHEVIRTRAGIPITLAVVVIAVARRVGVRAVGVGFPGHFLVRVEGRREGDAVLLDPFFRGREVTPAIAEQLARRTLGDAAQLRTEHLATTDVRSMTVRMLSNLRAIHERRGDHPNALVVCDRLVDLTGSVDARRSRAAHLLALHAVAAAIDDLEAWLRARPDHPDAAEVRRTLTRARGTDKRTLQ